MSNTNERHLAFEWLRNLPVSGEELKHATVLLEEIVRLNELIAGERLERLEMYKEGYHDVLHAFKDAEKELKQKNKGGFVSYQCPMHDTGGGPCYCDKESTIQAINLPFEKIKPIDYERVIIRLQKERGILFESLEEEVEKVAEYENDINTLKEIIHEVGGCDASEEYARGWDEAVNEIERQAEKHLSHYNKPVDIKSNGEKNE